MMNIFFLPFHINWGVISKNFASTFELHKDYSFNIFGEIYLCDMSPCGTPCLRKILSVKIPFIMMQASLSLKNLLIQLRILLPKPKSKSTFYIYQCEIMSKAFQKFISRTMAGILSLFMCFIIFRRLSIQLPILFLLIYASVFSYNDSTAGLFLLVMQQQASL